MSKPNEGMDAGELMGVEGADVYDAPATQETLTWNFYPASEPKVTPQQGGIYCLLYCRHRIGGETFVNEGECYPEFGFRVRGRSMELLNWEVIAWAPWPKGPNQ